MTADLVSAPCSGSVEEVTASLLQALEDRDITVFATIDHAAGAREAGLELPEERVVIFGNPAVGTALMQESPTIGFELPLRMLIWDEAGTTRVAYEPPTALQQRFGIVNGVTTLQKLDALLGALSDTVSE